MLRSTFVALLSANGLVLRQMLRLSYFFQVQVNVCCDVDMYGCRIATQLKIWYGADIYVYRYCFQLKT